MEAVKPIFLKTVGWEAVIAAAAMLQAKQERSLLNPLEGIGRRERGTYGSRTFQCVMIFTVCLKVRGVLSSLSLLSLSKTFEKKCFLVWCKELGVFWELKDEEEGNDAWKDCYETFHDENPTKLSARQ